GNRVFQASDRTRRVADGEHEARSVAFVDLDDRRRVVDLDNVAVPPARQGAVGRVRQPITGNHTDNVAAVGDGGRVPHVDLADEIVDEIAPGGVAVAPILHGVGQQVVVGVFRAPGDRL